MRKPKSQGKGIVKALGQKGTTGNFAKIAAARGKGAAIGALQNKLSKRRGQPVPYGGKKAWSMTYIRIHRGKGLILLAAVVVLLAGFSLSHKASGSTVFGSCTQAKAAGYSNIPSTSHFYNPALDKDHDRVACE